MTGRNYDHKFIQYAAQSSAYAAGKVAALLAPALGVRSVLDVGCAAGTWLKAWSGQGVADIQGVDGDYVDRAMLEIPEGQFTPTDLNAAFDRGRTFDLVQSLEVGEHIKPASSDAFAESIARHAERFVLFSAAPPGQGGEHHINERGYEFWRAQFARHGFVAVDAVRPEIAGDLGISYWYRYNMFLYVRREALADVPIVFRQCLVADGVALADVSPIAFRVRKAVVRQLPAGVQNAVAQLKSRYLPTGRF